MCTVKERHTSIGNFADLHAVHEILSLANLRSSEIDNVFGVQEVDKGIADIAAISEVDSQIHEVEATFDREV